MAKVSVHIQCTCMVCILDCNKLNINNRWNFPLTFTLIIAKISFSKIFVGTFLLSYMGLVYIIIIAT